MSTKIILKKSSTAGAVPLTGDLDLGELAINVVDRKVYTKDNSGAIIKVNGAYVDSVAPSTPAEGDIWYDTTNNLLKAYNGSAWEAAGYTTLTQFGVTATATELNYVDGVTSSIQTQLDGKASTSHTHVVANITDLTATATELNYVDGVTSSIQTQLDGKSSTSHNHSLDSLSNVTINTNSAGEILKWDGTVWVNNTLAEAGISAVGHTHTAANITDFTEAAQDAVGTIISGSGIASVVYNDAAGTIVVTATEADTLNSVTTRGATTANGITVGSLETTGNVTVGGNLIVNGTTTTVNSNTVNIGDNIIVLNADETGVPSQNAGFEVERGTSANVAFMWDETADAWDFNSYPVQNVTIDGGTY